MLKPSICRLAAVGVYAALALVATAANAQTLPAASPSPAASIPASPVPTPTPLPHRTLALDAQPVPAASALPLVAPSAASSPAPAMRRALDAPLDSIFPSSDFPGPAYLIGVPASSGNRLYGWLDTGIEFSTSGHSNFPMSYNDVPNSPQLDQAVVRFDKEPDTVQQSHFDWGYRFTSLYGVDYRYTTMEGVLSNQLLLRNQTNGYDPVEAYLVGYFPHIGQGTTVQLGRYISPPDIEANLSPQNFLYTHSLMFTFDCYTQMGALFTTMLSKYWTLVYGIHGETDTALWDGSAHFPTALLLARWVSHSNRNSIFFGVDAINTSGQFKTWTKGTFVNASTGQVQPLVWGHDNLQQFNATWTHVFNPGFQNQFEAYYLYSLNAYVGGTINNYNVATAGPVYLGAGGGPGAYLPGLSSAVGLVDYLEAKVGPTTFGSLRFDYLNDPRGWRSGFSTAYSSYTFGVTQHFGSGPLFDSIWELRPEIRVETAYRPGVTPYNNGTTNHQTTFGMDAVLFYGNP
jgi:hypothetical protein